MHGSPAELLGDFANGRLTRRHLLQGLAALALPAVSLAQGAATRRAPTTRVTTPQPMPFESTGWNTVWLDHLSYQCVDYRKAAAFYATLLGWRVRSDDGRQCTLDIGENCGSMVIRGGLQATAAMTGGVPGVQPLPLRAVIDGYAWGITPWNAGKVRAALEQRGLQPVTENIGTNYESFRIKDPDGFSLAITNGTRQRRSTPAAGRLPAPAPFEPTGWSTQYLDHISFEVADYRRSAAFYQALLGWQVRNEQPGQSVMQIGNVAGAIIRNYTAGLPTPLLAKGVSAVIRHISFGLKDWDTERVRAALGKRNLVYVMLDGKREPWADMNGAFASFHVPDAMGWDLQVSNKVAPGG